MHLVCYVSLCEGLRAGAGSLSYIVHVDCCGLSTIVIKKIIIIIIIIHSRFRPRTGRVYRATRHCSFTYYFIIFGFVFVRDSYISDIPRLCTFSIRFRYLWATVQFGKNVRLYYSAAGRPAVRRAFSSTVGKIISVTGTNPNPKP